jgi:hypothetical protein
MAVSRPILLALLAAVVAAAAFYASGAGRQSDDPTSFEPAPVQPTATQEVSDAGKPESGRTQAAAGGRKTAAERKKAAAERKEAAAEKAERRGAPRPVLRALAARRTVVLFFFKRGSADDSATARSVSAVRGMNGVSVFTAPIGRLADYQAVVGSLGVSQAPAVVIVGKRRRAQLTEGFIDGKTLRQDILDLR